MPEFKTIRQTAATGLLPEYRIRIMVAQGSCPGFMAGNRFMVNVTALSEELDRMSREKEGTRMAEKKLPAPLLAQRNGHRAEMRLATSALIVQRVTRRVN